MSNSRKIFATLIAILVGMLTTLVVAQKSEDSNHIVDSLLRIAKLKDDTNAVNARIQLFLQYDLKNPTKAKAHLDKASELSSLKNYTKGLAEISRYYGVYYSTTGNYEKAEKYIKKSQDYYGKIKDKEGLIHCFNELAILESQRGNLDKALQYYLVVQEKSQQIGRKDWVARVYLNIGLIHYNLNENHKAEVYYKKAYQILKKQDNLYGLMHVYSKRGTNFLQLKQYKKALNYMNSSLNIARELEDSIEQSVIEQNIGSYYVGIGKIDSALIHYYNSKVLSEKMGLKQQVALAQFHIGSSEYKLGNVKKAIQATEEALGLSKKIGDQLRVMNSYILLSEIYESQGNHKLALDFNKRGNVLKDSLKGVEVLNNMNELKTAYEVSEKDNENQVLQEQNKHKQLKVRQLYTVLIAIGILFSSIIIFILLFVRQKKIKSKLIQTELEQKALRAQMNPHFIFNALNSIQRMYIEGKEDIANEYMADFSRLLRTILENSGKRFIKLKEELEITKLYLDLEKLRTDNLFEFKINIDEELNIENMLIPPLTLQPYLENAIWHGIIPNKKEGLIEINIIRKNLDNLLVEILDNGIGINQSKSLKKESDQSSLGMQITSQRLGGNDYVKIEEIDTGGTKISLTIKYTK